MELLLPYLVLLFKRLAAAAVVVAGQLPAVQAAAAVAPSLVKQELH